jgi:hypothetical protein
MEFKQIEGENIEYACKIDFRSTSTWGTSTSSTTAHTHNSIIGTGKDIMLEIYAQDDESDAEENNSIEATYNSNITSSKIENISGTKSITTTTKHVRAVTVASQSSSEHSDPNK